MVNRRTFLKSTGAVGSIGLVAGCIGGGGGGSSQPYIDGKLKFLMSPTEPQEQMRAQYEPIGKHLASYVEATDNVQLQYARNYAATLTALGSGTADIAETGPFAAALGVDADRAEIILQRYGYGSWTYSSVIVTRQELMDSGEITSLTDLKGKRIAFADALSASGSLYPLAMLKEAGLSVPDEPGSPSGADFEPTWSSHGTAFKSLVQGNADAAGVGKFITLNDKRNLKEGVAIVKERSGIPRAPIVVSPMLTDKEKQTITDAFTEAPNDVYYGADGKKDTADDLWFNDVRPADASTYQPVVDVANTLGYSEEIFKQ